MKIHELKTDPIPFSDVYSGLKTFEIRKDDRHFQVGDVLHCRETLYSGAAMKTNSPLLYTGRELLAEVSCVLRGYGLVDGWVVMSINVLYRWDGRRVDEE